MNNNSNWFSEFKKSEEYEAFVKNPVAYFSAEYALDSSLPTYAGGLGVLSGDYVRETAREQFPLLAVGLFYKKAQGVLSVNEKNNLDKLKVVTDGEGEEVLVSLPFKNRNIVARAWQWEENGAKVYLLDTDVPQNNENDRGITRELYNENRDIRLEQEIVLGIGGFRLLAQLGHHASVYHLNEGHSAFLALELIRHEMEHQNVGFQKACDFAKKHILFTNHTIVPAGQEKFSTEKVVEFIDPCAKEICLNSWEIGKLGQLENEPGVYSMTTMSFRLSTKSNSVSKVHLEKAREVWPGIEMENVTNGIFIDRWDKIVQADISEQHRENKRKLLSLVKSSTGEGWGEKDLIFAWGRRMVPYKQPLLILDDVEKIKKISKNSPVPVRIVFSGPTGQLDNTLIDMVKKIGEEDLKGMVAFIPNYSLEVAETLSAGADVWLNTPMIGFEACGTSGMKAALNGTLNLSTKDGWMAEVGEGDVGWAVDNSQNGEALRKVIELEIIPLYNEYLKNPQNSKWAEKMMKARNNILENFSTARVLREYVEKLYIPILKQKHTHKIDRPKNMLQ